MVVPLWVTVQIMFSCPVLSAEVPDQVPVRLVADVGDGLVGADELVPHAKTTMPAKTAKLR